MITQKYKGAVCYIDLLGFSYLSRLLKIQKKIPNKQEKNIFSKKVDELTLEELRDLPGLILLKDEISNESEDYLVSEWSYTIIDGNLKKFQKIIANAISKKQQVKTSFLSDSVFLFSENVDNLILCVADIFRNSVKEGILLRAGLSFDLYYGVQINDKYNIYGPAVTNAVNYESMGKGCRVFTDDNFHKNIKDISKSTRDIVHPYPDYRTYELLDSFEWLMINNDYSYNENSVTSLHSLLQKQLGKKNIIDIDIENYFSFADINTDEKRLWDLINENIFLIIVLKYSTTCDWNRETNEGKKQILASILYLEEVVKRMLGIKYDQTSEFMSYDEKFSLIESSDSEDIAHKFNIAKKQYWCQFLEK